MIALISICISLLSIAMSAASAYYAHRTRRAMEQSEMCRQMIQLNAERRRLVAQLHENPYS